MFLGEIGRALQLFMFKVADLFKTRFTVHLDTGNFSSLAICAQDIFLLLASLKIARLSRSLNFDLRPDRLIVLYSCGALVLYICPHMSSKVLVFSKWPLLIYFF